MSELQCLFCGNRSEVLRSGAGFWVYCDNDGCGVAGPTRKTEAEAIAAFTMPEAVAAAVQAEREACARAIGDLPITDHVEARRVVIDGMRAIRSRPAPAVDVIGVVREYLAALTDFKKAAIGDDFDAITATAKRFDVSETALRGLVDGAAAKG